MRQGSIQLITNGNMTGDITSVGINLISIYAYSIQGVWSGGSGPSGSFVLQGSNDSCDVGSGQAVNQPTHWTPITGSTQAISGTPGSILYDVVECSYRWVRLVYTHASGSATLNVLVNVKGV